MRFLSQIEQRNSLNFNSNLSYLMRKIKKRMNYYYLKKKKKKRNFSHFYPSLTPAIPKKNVLK
jgi:hypothetical protein